MIDTKDQKPSPDGSELKTVRVLLVDDDEDEYFLIRRMLSARTYQWASETPVTFQVDWTASYQEAVRAFKRNSYDAYLVDYHLVNHTGIELLEEAARLSLPAPIIILTGAESYAVDAAAARLGAADYLVKKYTNAQILERSIRYAVERKQAEEKLRRANDTANLLTQELFRTTQRLQTILKTLPAGVMIAGADGTILHTNDMISTILGPTTSSSAQDFASKDFKSWQTVSGSQDEDREWALQRALRRGEPSIGDVIDIEDLDGRKTTILGSAAPIYDEDEQVAGGVFVCLDLTNQRNLENQIRLTAQEAENYALEAREERNRLLNVIAHAPSAFLVTDQYGGIVIANQSAESLFGPITAGVNVRQAPFFNFELPDGTPCPAEDLPILRSLSEGETFINEELVLVKGKGQKLHLLANSTPLRDRTGRITGTVGIFQNITERKLEEERAVRHAMRIDVQQHLIHHQEMERLRIARDLHDGPMQELIAIHLGLDEIQHQWQQRLGDGMSQETTGLLHELGGLKRSLKHQINELRSFTRDLRPPLISALGLDGAVRSHLKKFSQKHPEIELVAEIDLKKQEFPEETILAVFRILQELLNNITRHAEAGRVSVHMGTGGGELKLVVSDNGKGFSVPQQWTPLARSGHLGLIGVQERVKAVGGDVSITSEVGRGTLIEVCVPLEG
jgi:PAS domain S-box-containing protein